MKKKSFDKKGIWKLIRMTAFAVVLAIAVSVTYNALSWKDTQGFYLSSVKALYATDDELIDVVFVGSSHVYCGILPYVLWEDKGIAAFDMAISGQDRVSAYHSLKEVLKTQSPKVVMVDLYGMYVDKYYVEGNLYRNMLSLKPSVNSFKEVMSYTDDSTERKNFLFRWPIVHTRVKELEKRDFMTYRPNEFSRGAVPGWTSQNIDFSESQFECEEIAELSEKNREWLEDLVKLSKECDFDLYLIVMPYYIDLDETQMIYNGMKQFADQNGIGFYDCNNMMDELNLSGDVDFLDGGHLNAIGATKMTRFIESEVLDKYNLPDHRGDSRYYQWDLDKRWNELNEVESRLNKEWDVKTFLEILMENPEITAVISLEGDFLEKEYDYVTPLSTIGISAEEAAAGGKWLYRNGSITKILDNVPGQEYVLDLSKTDTLKVGYYEDYADYNIMIGKLPCSGAGLHLSIVLYNEFTDRFMFTRAL